MSRLIARYRPSRRYAMFAVLALASAILAAWLAPSYGKTWIAVSAFMALTAALTLVLATRPTLEIHGTHLRIGKRVVLWNEIRKLDRISALNRQPWIAPLLLRLTLPKQQELMILHSGDADSCLSLLRHIYRYSRSAELDGVPYNEFWGEEHRAAEPLALPQPRLLLPEDEEEVERLFQRLKVAGRLDGSDETQR